MFHFDYLHHRMKGLCQNCHFHMKKFPALKKKNHLFSSEKSCCLRQVDRLEGDAAPQPQLPVAHQRVLGMLRTPGPPPCPSAPREGRCGDHLALCGCQVMVADNVGHGQGKTRVPKVSPSPGQWASRAGCARCALHPVSTNHPVRKGSGIDGSLEAVDQRVSRRLVCLKCQALR